MADDSEDYSDSEASNSKDEGANEWQEYDDTNHDVSKVSCYEYDVEEEYERIFDREEVTMRKAWFELPNNLPPTPQTFQSLYWSNELFEHIVQCTNDYARDHLAPSMVRDVTVAEMMRFFAVIQYMGVVVLKAKDNYFHKNHPVFPTHHAVKLSNARFSYIWSNFHLCYCSAKPTTDELTDEEDEHFDRSLGAASALFGLHPRHFRRYTDEELNGTQGKEERWYLAVRGLIAHVNKISKLICRVPGIILSLDEMLRRFKGRSAQTERLARNPNSVVESSFRN